MSDEPNAGTRQASFVDPVDRAREIIERVARLYDADGVTLTVSGGTDSVVAADLMCRLGPEYGLDPDSVTHINTGAAVPQSRLVAKIIADVHDLEFIEQGYRNEQDALAHRVLGDGWPGKYQGSPMAGGHGLEWANRKDKPMDAVYVQLDGLNIWVSGARKLESKERQARVPDSGINQDRPRRVWVSPIAGWTAAEKREYIRERGLPVSQSYLVLGYSGECTACSFDERALLDNLELLSPHLAHALRTLVVWLVMRQQRGDVDLETKRLCWGWPPEDTAIDEAQTTLTDDVAQSMVGCDKQSCATREMPSWVRDLPEWQIVDLEDTWTAWGHGVGAVSRRFDHLNTENQPKTEATANV